MNGIAGWSGRLAIAPFARDTLHPTDARDAEIHTKMFDTQALRALMVTIRQQSWTMRADVSSGCLITSTGSHQYDPILVQKTGK
jgi:hypothetical protein